MVSAKRVLDRSKKSKEKKNHQSNSMYDCSKTHLNDALLSHIPATKEVTYKEPQPTTSLTISQVTESLGAKMWPQLK